MNKAAKLVSNSLLDQQFVTKHIAGKTYTIYPPTIRVLCRAISQFSLIGMDGTYNRLDVLAEMPQNVPYILRGLAYLIVGEKPFGRYRSFVVAHRLSKATLEELRECVDAILPLLGGDDFFACAASLKSIAKVAAQEK